MIILRLSLANLKKKKGASFTFIVFILLAATLMNIGLTLFTKMESFYEQKEAETNGAQFVAMSSVNTYKKDFEKYVFNDKRVLLAEKEEVIYMPTTKNNKNKLEYGAVIFNKDMQREIAPLIPVNEDYTVPKDKAIYVPIMLKKYNIAVGDDYVITYKGKKYSFIVAGFFETLYYGSIGGGCSKYFVSNECYEKLYSDIGRATILSARFKDNGKGISAISETFTQEFIDTTNYRSVSEESVLSCMSAASMKNDYMGFVSIVAVMLIAFALVICLIIIAVIYNRVVENIEESMQNIGVLQAIGYTTKQIMLSIVMEYFVLCILGSLLGILLSYAVTPILSNYLNTSGIIWNSGIHIMADSICFIILLIIINLTALLGTVRILKLPPVKALTKTTKNYQSSKNICPLHKGIGSVHFRIGLKNLLCNKKSNLSFTLIVAGGVFAIGLALVMYMNFSLDNSALMNACGFELSDLQITVTKHTDAQEFANQLSQMSEVRKTNLSTLATAKLENYDVQVIISSNFDAMEVLSTYDGTLPSYDNEIAITGVMSKMLHKEIGDTVKVTSEGRTQEYIVTGIYQTSNNSGHMSILPLDAIKKICPQFEINQIDIYLNEDVDKEEFKEKLRSVYKVAVNEEEASTDNNLNINDTQKYSKAAKIADEKIARLLSDYGVNSVSYSVMLNGELILSGDSSAYKINEITDLKDYLDGQLDSYGGMMSGMVTIISVVTFLIIGGILTITIKAQIRAKRREYGIYKSMGYTTGNLVRQLSLNFAITSILGTIIGSIATMLLANSILRLLLADLGLTRIKLRIDSLSILILDCFVVLFIYILAMVKAYKIKEITAYDLLTE